MSTEQKPKQAELSSNSVTATDGPRRVLLPEERLTQKSVSKIQQKTNKNTLRAPTAPRSTPRQLVSPILLKDTASNRIEPPTRPTATRAKQNKKKGRKSESTSDAVGGACLHPALPPLPWWMFLDRSSSPTRPPRSCGQRDTRTSKKQESCLFLFKRLD